MKRPGAPRPATYQLFIRVACDRVIRVGRLGTFRFPAGRYVYTGSAARGLEARIARHLAREKRLFWHVDYLLAAPGVRVEAVRRSTRPECALAGSAAGTTPAPGFGASDCRAGCVSHLRYLGP
ncbi:MAG: GIY-YIG nuclease family protein [Burkholderiales bacterium]|nr:GIY-YIG nuclease family protein [Burkholderiales bacterium]